MAACRCRGSRTKTMPLSYRTLSHLWASVAHESASAKPFTRCARAGAAAAQSPKAPSTWTQAPASLARGMISAAGSNAPVLTSPACRHTIVSASSRGIASLRILPWPSTGALITRSRPRPSSVNALRTLMDLLADDDRDRRRSKQAPCLHIPSPPREQCVSSRRQAGEVRLRRAGDEAGTALRRQPQQAQHPAHRDFLELGGDRREDHDTRVLIPGACKPVRRQRRRKGAADDEAEETPARRGHRRRRSQLIQLRDDGLRVGRRLWKRLV